MVLYFSALEQYFTGKVLYINVQQTNNKIKIKFYIKRFIYSEAKALIIDQ